MSSITPKLIKELREKSGSGFLDCKKALEATQGNVEEAIKWLIEQGKASAAKRLDKIAAEGVILSKTFDSNKKGVIIELNCETDFVAKNTDFLDLSRKIIDLLITNSAAEKILKVSEEIKDLVTSFSARSGEKISLRRFEFLSAKPEEFIVDYTHTNNKFGVLFKVKGTFLEDLKEAARGVAMHIGALNPKYALRGEVDSKKLQEIQADIENSPALIGKNPQVREKIMAGLLQKAFSEFVLEDQVFAVDTSFSVGNFLKQKSLSIVEFVRFEVAEGIQKPVSDFAKEVLEQIK